jgi:hypothetical protein
MAWIVIGSTVVGGMMANSAAKKQANAIDKANEQNNQYLNAAMPYINTNLDNVSGYYNDMITKGPYQGSFYAGPNTMQTGANNQLYNLGNNLIDRGDSTYNMGVNYAAPGMNFGNNANSLYNQFTGMSGDFTNRVGQIDALANNQMNLANDYSNIRDGIGNYRSNFNDLATNSQGVTDRFGNLADKALNDDRMGTASQYALDNMNPIVDAMMRDDRRTLTEQTLPGINLAASASGNPNSSRAGVADALANRAFDDRRADVSSDVFNSLKDASLTQANTQFNQGMTGTVNMANNMANTGGFYGDAMNTYVNQGNMTGNMGTAYGNAGTALTSGNNTMTSAGNMLSNAGVANNMLNTATTTGMNMANQGNNTAISGANTALGAGNNQQGYDQGQLDADRSQFDYLTGYNYNLGKDYGSFLASPGVQGKFQTNTVNPAAETFAGMNSGFGFGTQYGPQISNGFQNMIYGQQQGPMQPGMSWGY